MRETRTESAGFDATRVCRDTNYNATGEYRGRVEKTTEPYACSNGTTVYTTYKYDPVGRTVETNGPKGLMKAYYLGLTKSGVKTLHKSKRVTNYSTGTNATEWQTREEYTNSQGKLVRVVDALSNALNMRYDAYGNLVRTIRYDAKNNPVTTTIGYDARGRKRSLDDPDTHTTQYRYNAFGDLVWQKDANGNIVRQSYDLAGRMTLRTEPDYAGTSTRSTHYEYDTATNGKGKLAKTCVPYRSGACHPEDAGGHQEQTDYDSLGRVQRTHTTIEGRAYDTNYTYDSFSRASTVTYPASGEAATAARLIAHYEYRTDSGAMERVCTVSAVTNTCVSTGSKTIWNATAANVAGQITGEDLGNGLKTTRVFDDGTHRIDSIVTTNGANQKLQDLGFRFDTLGNLNERSDNLQRLGTINGVTERFYYDSLNRLSSVTLNTAAYRSYQYDKLGNLTYKSDLGYLNYGENGAGPHAVTSVRSGTTLPKPNGSVVAGDANADRLVNEFDIDTVAQKILEQAGVAGGKPDCTSDTSVDVRDLACINNKIALTGSSAGRTYSYDANGNQIGGDGRRIRYTAGNKPWNIVNRKAMLYFYYGVGDNRVVQTGLTPEGYKKTHYVGKLFERVQQESGVFVYNNFIYAGGRLIALSIQRSNNTSAMRYFLSDHQGSVDAVVNESAAVAERFSYDPFGQRRGAQWQDGSVARLIQDILATGTDSGRRGYTGHEMLDGVALIHMNGRVYDPALGRFLSADIVVQFAGNSQSYNRYSYVLNNPLSYTDPSGYSLLGALNDLFEPVTKFFARYGRSIVAIAFGAMLGPVSPVLAGFIAGYISSGGNMEAAVIGAITASMFWGVGEYFGHVTNATNLGAKMIAHAAVGGISNAMGGGNFMEGFAAGFVTQGLSMQISSMQSIGVFGRTVVAAVVGGVTAEAMGGSFANGAVTGAFSRLFNDEATHVRSSKDKIYALGIHSNTNANAEFTDGHAWLSVTDIETGETHTYGLWKDGGGLSGISGTEGQGVMVDEELKRGYAAESSRYELINQSQYDSLQTFRRAPDTWYPTHTCADWARDGFYAATRVYLDVDDNFGFETPREVSRAIGR